MPTFEFAVYFIRVKSSLILSCSSRPFLLYYAICWMEERRELWMREGGGG